MHVTRVLSEGVLRYPTRWHEAPGIRDYENLKEVRVFVIDWWVGGTWSRENEGGSVSRATVMFREEVADFPGERMPVPVGAIREVDASGAFGDMLTLNEA
jgi:hypothetical protein